MKYYISDTGWLWRHNVTTGEWHYRPKELRSWYYVEFAITDDLRKVNKFKSISESDLILEMI